MLFWELRCRGPILYQDVFLSLGKSSPLGGRKVVSGWRGAESSLVYRLAQGSEQSAKLLFAFFSHPLRAAHSYCECGMRIPLLRAEARTQGTNLVTERKGDWPGVGFDFCSVTKL
jgi:hypothetical protein